LNGAGPLNGVAAGERAPTIRDIICFFQPLGLMTLRLSLDI
jgi:hypothetical protein